MNKGMVRKLSSAALFSMVSLVSLVVVGFGATLFDYSFYIPIVNKPMPPTATFTLTPTSTFTSTPTSTFTPTTSVQATFTFTPTRTFSPTPTFTPTPNPALGNIDITSISYNGSGSTEPDEYVVIKNIDTHAIQLGSWTLRDSANHIYTFPTFLIAPQQICRVYTNQSHPEYCGFNYGSNTAIWNNSGDCAYLRNAQGTQVDQFCY